MGLDWVVIAKEENGREINPTDILGVRRASKTDPEVVERLRELYSDRGERLSFDDWLDSLVTADPPPIVIPFGEDCRDAIPGVQAEVQYYGFRAKALEPEINRVSAFAVEDGRSLDWLWNDHDTTEQIDASVQQYAMDQKLTSAGTVTVALLTGGTDPYLRSTPTCPSGGTYTLATVGAPVTCSIALHKLP